MTRQRFGHMFSNNPKMIILDSKDYTSYITNKLVYLGLDYITDNITILETIFICLGDEYRLEHNLRAELGSILSDVSGFLHSCDNGELNYDHNCTMVLEALVNTALAIHGDLLQMNAYKNGRLGYNYVGKNGLDIVLLSDDVLPEEWKRINFALLKG